MSINFGGRRIKTVYYGDRKIKKAYLGSRLVYQAFNGRDRGQWALGVSYETDDVFHFEGRRFRVLREHISSRFINPQNANRLTAYMEEI